MLYVYNIVIFTLNLSISLLLFFGIKKQQRRNTKYIVDSFLFTHAHNRALTDQDQKWLFESLYSIDKGVKLPEEKAVIKTKEKIKVFKPSEDPMREYRGEKDDWFS